MYGITVMCDCYVLYAHILLMCELDVNIYILLDNELFLFVAW